MLKKTTILELFQNSSQSFTWNQIKQKANVQHYDIFYFKKIMYELFDNEVLLQDAEGIIYFNNPRIVFKGHIKINRKNFGFIANELKSNISYFVNPNNLNNSLNNDYSYFILVKQQNSKYELPEAKIIKLIERSLSSIVGLIQTSYYNKKYLSINNLDLQQYKTSIINPKIAIEQHYFKADLINFKKGIVYVKLTKDLGHASKVGMDIMSIVHEYNIPTVFSDEVLEQTYYVPSTVNSKEVKNYDKRINLKDKLLVTIDGEDSKDFDDAICVEKLLNNNYLLTVAIADVSHYVTPKTPLDNIAKERGFSLYLIDQVIPMLPEKLSNGICSLNPNVERLCMTCQMEIDNKGQVIKTKIFEGIMKSHARLTYRRVNDFLKNQISLGNQKIEDMLIDAYQLFKILYKLKKDRGFVEFSIKEPKFKLNSHKEIIDISFRIQDVAENLIEAFMVAANESVASYIWEKEFAFIYRNHSKPRLEKIENLIHQLSGLGYTLHLDASDLTSKDIQEALKAIVDKGANIDLVSSIFLRSMEKADYEVDNIGHFGLASKCYTHFTSPIRRYPDLIVHRYLKNYLIKNHVEDQKETGILLKKIANLSNQNELKTVDCMRAVNQMKMAEFMIKFIGKTYNGFVSAVTKFGIFVQLPNLIEGLIHITKFTDDYYEFDSKLFILKGKNTKREFKVGTEVMIMVNNADKYTRQIDFELV